MNCKQCDKRFTYDPNLHEKRKFCSKDCMGLSFRVEKISIECPICKTIRLRIPSKTYLKHCSIRCSNKIPVNKFYSIANEDQLLEKLKELYEKHVVKKDGCWEWKGNKDKDGYGKFNFNNKYTSAHRASWIIHNGPIPKGMFVLHHCDQTFCSRPDHLFIGSAKDNRIDCMNKGRSNICKGSNHAFSKLKDNDIIEIRNLLKNKTPQKEIANKFNVRPETISKINLRKRWKHIL